MLSICPKPHMSDILLRDNFWWQDDFTLYQSYVGNLYLFAWACLTSCCWMQDLDDAILFIFLYFNHMLATSVFCLNLSDVLLQAAKWCYSVIFIFILYQSQIDNLYFLSEIRHVWCPAAGCRMMYWCIEIPAKEKINCISLTSLTGVTIAF